MDTALSVHLNPDLKKKDDGEKVGGGGIRCV